MTLYAVHFIECDEPGCGTNVEGLTRVEAVEHARLAGFVKVRQSRRFRWYCDDHAVWDSGRNTDPNQPKEHAP